jgi:hypothetical protein
MAQRVGLAPTLRRLATPPPHDHAPGTTTKWVTARGDPPFYCLLLFDGPGSGAVTHFLVGPGGLSRQARPAPSRHPALEPILPR